MSDHAAVSLFPASSHVDSAVPDVDSTPAPSPVAAAPPADSAPAAAATASPFNAFLSQGPAARRSTRARSLTYALSLGAHAAGVIAAACHSFWHVDELTPRAVSISFLTAPLAAPPPPPPPAARPRSEARPKRAATPTPVRPIVAPQEVAAVEPEPATAPEADEPAAESGGEAGGAAGGIQGGIVAASVAPPPPPPPKPSLAPSERRALLLEYAERIFRGRIFSNFRYPPEAERLGAEGVVLVRVSIDGSGKLVAATRVGACPYEVLCEDAERTVARSAPFPAPPEALGALIRVDVPFNYRLP